MTIVAAIREPNEGVIFYGADTMAMRYGMARKVQKWIVRDNWVCGVSGALRVIDIIDGLEEAPSSAWDFANRAKAAIVADQFELKQDESAPYQSSDFVYADRSGLFAIGADFSVIEWPNGELCATGSGSDYAYGAMIPLRTNTRPSRRVEVALEAACACCHYCDGPTEVTATIL